MNIKIASELVKIAESLIVGRDIAVFDCAVCGGPAPARQQWWNRDSGYGICPECWKESVKRYGLGTSEHLYGKEGIHHSVQASSKTAKQTWEKCISDAKKNPDVKDPEALCGWLKSHGPNASAKNAAAPGVRYPSPGYYVVKAPFKIGLGAWRMTFYQGMLYRVNDTSRLSVDKWNAESAMFVPLRTGAGNFVFVWNSTYEDGNLCEPFLRNTDKISDAEMKRITQEMVVDGVMYVAEALKLLQRADPQAHVYIRLEK